VGGLFLQTVIRSFGFRLSSCSRFLDTEAFFADSNEVDLSALAKKAGEASSAEAVYLFGSQASGQARADSDVDLALILNDACDPWRAVLEAQRALWPREVSIDLAPISEQVWLTSKDSFVNSIRKEGRLLYSKDG